MKRDYHLVAEDGVASVSELQADYERALRRRPTPQTTIEAVMYCVRNRGVEALKEPANLERIKTFDELARVELNTRIATLIQKGLR